MNPLKRWSLIPVLVLTLSLPVLATSGYEEERERQQSNTDTRYDLGKPILATILTTFNIPFRGLLCVSDVGMGYIVMGASAGRRYAQAADFIEQGCEGPWILTPGRIWKEQQKVEKLKGAVFTPYDQW